MWAWGFLGPTCKLQLIAGGIIVSISPSNSYNDSISPLIFKLPTRPAIYSVQNAFSWATVGPATLHPKKISVQDRELTQLVHGQLDSFSFCDAELQRSMNRTSELEKTWQKWEALHGRCSSVSMEFWESFFFFLGGGAVWDNGIYTF